MQFDCVKHAAFRIPRQAVPASRPPRTHAAHSPQDASANGRTSPAAALYVHFDARSERFPASPPADYPASEPDVSYPCMPDKPASAMCAHRMLSDNGCFYYCDEHFSYIQSEIEKRIFGLMLERLGKNEQLIFTTHNTDMLDLNLPKHSFAFLKKEIAQGVYQVTVTFASEILKRNTDSVKCAMENDVFGSLPDDSLLDELEVES